MATSRIRGVTIPTEVAVSETTRLLDTLEKENIACRRLVVNQMISGPVNELTLEEGEETAARKGRRRTSDVRESIPIVYEQGKQKHCPSWPLLRRTQAWCWLLWRISVMS